MAEPNLNQSFSPSNTTGPVVSGAHSHRYGCFAARMHTTHRHKLVSPVGRTPKGTNVLVSVQSIITASTAVQESAKWVCANPLCAGKSWPTKNACMQEHGDERKLIKDRETHCVFALGTLPADKQEIANVYVQKSGTANNTVISLREPHGVNLGDVVEISDVMGNATNRVGDLDAMFERLMSKVEERFFNKADAVKKLEKAASSLSLLSINGAFMVAPLSATTFMIPQELDGTFVKPKDPSAPRPMVLLHPERPVLLSDEE
jgi:hypothetical protein